ncbi:23S rRNA (uracil(1939)-C(5))-methyltransferase RlmD [Pseudobacillus badius]|uniref:23S rRNA (uracil(1939)-C(5))-methyltransferase RlmD n=1 Tax=Bacillus badius TaxID=1455 RepID=UPI0007B0A7E8|nr:23S rRNA (uracil(1939)-C(5))-methyltransferase RlmD [Bacillus badius]KZO01340.1 23S rRNA (uracil-5-)-methyltransferase RumA [Bacillus badius]OCS89645.1 23S rRNA (uracil-5-)-methyltransferase RumA [Bacillus badius]OVE51004.1 23S rRNA (uracil-5-)-methyltransferase RumA [Bacillus badius]TDW01818.1 23S rRNA m(5)U-1939 methyltransferase [Bacillus badius]
MKQEDKAKIKAKQTFPLTIKRIGINGEGVGYFKRQVVFVPGALPGEEVVVEAVKVHPKFTEGRIKKIRKKSEHRTVPPCSVYDQCGGCQLQHMTYSEQLRAKRDILIQALERYTKVAIDTLDIRPAIGMEEPWFYRNKSQFQVGKQDGMVIAGLYSMNSHKLIDIPNCIVQQPVLNDVLKQVKQILQDFNISIYDEKKNKGAVKTVVVRVGVATGDVQVVIVTAVNELPKKELITQEIQKRLPHVKSIIHNINPKKTSLIFGEKSVPLAGPEAIEERLGNRRYTLSARAFFQLNPEQTAKLYDEVKRAAQLTGSEKVVDAYCGSGTIGLWIGEGAAEIRGMDVIPESIKDARENAKALKIKAVYEVGTAEQWLPAWLKAGWKPDVVIVDPPRTGCDQKLLDTVKKVKPKRFVYVSCNPSTLAKDIHQLSRLYKIEYIQPVDMFPQTAHVESVTLLTLKGE